MTRATDTSTLAPASLFETLVKGAAGDSPDDALSTRVRVAQDASRISFENPPGSIGRSPEGAGALEDGTPASELWRIEGLSVASGAEGLSIAWRLGRLESSPGTPYGLGKVMLDAYLDLNGVPGAGATTLLEGRKAYAQSRDAWEYALTVSGWGAFLYRSSPQGSPLLVAQLSPELDLERSEVRVRIPSKVLRGNPSLWGYIALAMAADPASAREGRPPLPVPAAPGTAVLGILAPLEQQQAFVKAAAAGRGRLAAVRAPRKQ